MHTQILLAFFTYFGILLSIGLLAHRKQNTSADFILGNRSLNFWLTALSAHASDMSAWLFMAFPAAVFVGGIQQIWTALGLIIGMFCNWHFIAQKLRTATESKNSYTLSTFFEKRFSDDSGLIRIITASMILIFLTIYLSAGLIGMGRLFESIFELDYYIGLIVASFVVMIYTFSGGFVTVAWTDFFQAIFLLFAILIVPIVAFFQLPNGIESISHIAQQKQLSLSFFSEGSPSLLQIIFLLLSWGLGYFGQPHIITKFMGIRDPNELYKSKYLGICWQIIALSAAAFVGFVGIGFFEGTLNNPELVFINMVKSLFFPFAAGMILCGLIAANMSTMDSQVLVCASALSEDFYKKIMRKNASEKELLKASKFSVVLVSLLALSIALNKNSSVLDVVFYAWAGLGCSFGPLVLMSLYAPSTNKYGAIAGILTGGFLAAFWTIINPYITHLSIPTMIPGFFGSLFIIYLVSQITNKEIELHKISN